MLVITDAERWSRALRFDLGSEAEGGTQGDERQLCAAIDLIEVKIYRTG